MELLEYGRDISLYEKSHSCAQDNGDLNIITRPNSINMNSIHISAPRFLQTFYACRIYFDIPIQSIMYQDYPLPKYDQLLTYSILSLQRGVICFEFPSSSIY